MILTTQGFPQNLRENIFKVVPRGINVLLDNSKIIIQ